MLTAPLREYHIEYIESISPSENVFIREYQHHFEAPKDMEITTPSRHRQPPRTDAQKIDNILRCIQDASWTLGKFLNQLLDPCAELSNKNDGAGSTSNKLNRHGSMLKSFMTGGSTDRPIHVVQKLFSHPLGQPKNRKTTDWGNYFTLDTPLSDIKYCQPAMSSWALQTVLGETDAEARWLCGKDSGLRVRATGKRSDREPSLTTAPGSVEHRTMVPPVGGSGDRPVEAITGAANGHAMDTRSDDLREETSYEGEGGGAACSTMHNVHSEDHSAGATGGAASMRAIDIHSDDARGETPYRGEGPDGGLNAAQNAHGMGRPIEAITGATCGQQLDTRSSDMRAEMSYGGEGRDGGLNAMQSARSRDHPVGATDSAANVYGRDARNENARGETRREARAAGASAVQSAHRRSIYDEDSGPVTTRLDAVDVSGDTVMAVADDNSGTHLADNINQHSDINTTHVQDNSERETRKRTHKITDPLVTWPIINQFSIPLLIEKYKRKAPVMWSLLYNFSTSKSDEDRGEETAEYRPRELVCMSTLSELVYTRNPWANLFPLCRGLCMFGTKAHQASYRIGSRLAQNAPYSTIRSALQTMSAETRKELREMFTGEDAKKAWVVLDNVQAYARRRDNRIGSGNRMVIGTGATAVVMEDCAPNAFELQPILDKIDEGARGKLTAKDITAAIDSEHIVKVRMFHWLEMLVSYVPELGIYRKEVSAMFQSGTRKHQINPQRKTNVQPLGTNSANEVTARGMKEAIVDFLGQLGLDKDKIGTYLQFVSGDGKSFDGMHQVKKLMSGSTDNHRAMRFLRPVLELWHTKWTKLSAIIRGHWGGEHGTSDPSTLGFIARLINSPKPADFSKVDFYPNTRLVSLAVQAHMLDCWATHFNAPDGLLVHFRMLADEGRLPSLTVLMQDAALLSRRYSSENAYLKALRAPAMDTHLDDVPIGVPWTPYAGPIPETSAVGRGAQIPEPEHDVAVPGGDETIQESSGASSSVPDFNVPVTNDFSPSNETNDAEGHAKFRGDWALANSILLMRDGIWYLEVVQAVALGDVGRVWEVLKIWILTFAGAGNSNYTAYLLEMFCNLELEYPKETRDALFNNWLVNCEGKPGNCLEMDLMQEHFNFWLEALAQYKGKEFDDPWYRETLSMHVHQLIRLVQEFEKNVQLAARRKAHSAPHMDNELNSAIEHCRSYKLHLHREGRDYGFHAPNHYSLGYTKLVDEGKLEKFIAKGMEEWHNKNMQIEMPEGQRDATTYLQPPITYDNGRVRIPTSSSTE